MLAVVAIGGNAISNPHKKEPISLQIRKIERVILQLKDLTKNYQLVITHGNGSEIGNLMLQQEKSKRILPKLPLDTLGAMTQGQLGYWIQQAIENILKKNAATIVTRVLVDKKDQAFKHPTKPVGPYYRKKFSPNTIKGTEGWRVVVPSPKPISIIDIDEIHNLIKNNFIVIACGGGGIPVYKKNSRLVGINAVIDKDLTSSCLARSVRADLLLILTDVPYAYLNYKKQNQTALKKLTTKEAKKLLADGQFPQGSMGPKIEAAVEFAECGGKAVITNFSSVRKALQGKAGTIVTR